MDDDRVPGSQLLSKTTPDLAALRAVAAGTASENGPLSTCKRILAVELPRVDAVEAAGLELDAATTALAEVGERRSRAQRSGIGCLPKRCSS